MHQFNEHHPEFKGFSDYYQTDIQPYQKASHRRFWHLERKGLIVAIGIIFSTTLSVQLFLSPQSFLFSVIVSIALTGISFLIYDMNKYPDGLKTDYGLILKVARFVDLHPSTEIEPKLLLWRSLGLLSDLDGQREILFNFAGTSKGVALSLMQVKTFAPNPNGDLIQSSEVVTFDGHLIRMDMPKAFEGYTIVYRDQGIGQARRRQGLKRVGLVDPIFEKIFEVYSSDQVEARALLTPDLMQEMVDLERMTQGKSIEFGFIAGQLLIKLSRPQLEVRKSLEEGNFNIVTTQNVINEISGILDIVDTITR